MDARFRSSHRSNGGSGARPARTFVWAWTVALVLVALTQSSCTWNGSVPSEPGRRSTPVLAKQQEWAAQRIPNLREQIIVARRAYETVELAVDFAATLGGISAAFHDLEAELPELIVFDVTIAELTAPGIGP